MQADQFSDIGVVLDDQIRLVGGRSVRSSTSTRPASDTPSPTASIKLTPLESSMMPPRKLPIMPLILRAMVIPAWPLTLSAPRITWFT